MDIDKGQDGVRSRQYDKVSRWLVSIMFLACSIVSAIDKRQDGTMTSRLSCGHFAGPRAICVSLTLLLHANTMKNRQRNKMLQQDEQASR